MPNEKILGVSVTINQVKPIDFIGEDGFVPLISCFISENRSKNVHEDAEKILSDGEDKEPYINSILNAFLSAGIDVNKSNKKEFIKDLIENYPDYAVGVFNKIYEKSFKLLHHFLKKTGGGLSISRENAISLDKKATRWGKTPIQLVAKEEDYTEMDAFIFNELVYRVALNDNLSQINSLAKKSGNIMVAIDIARGC